MSHCYFRSQVSCPNAFSLKSQRGTQAQHGLKAQAMPRIKFKHIDRALTVSVRQASLTSPVRGHPSRKAQRNQH